MRCARCMERDPLIGVICAQCSAQMSKVRMAPEQVEAMVEEPLEAALVDQWGRPHPLAANTIVGRIVDGPGISVREGSVSRHHVRLSYDRAQQSWSVRDLGSSNGTRVNDQVVSGPRELVDRDTLRIGSVGFLFVDDVATLPDAPADGTIGDTFRPEDGRPALTARAEPIGQLDDETLRRADIHLLEPTGGGGGVLDVDGKQLQLSPTQFELLSVLVERMRTEADQPELVRGFVRTSELIGDLSWDTPHPGDNHVKQLVRRVRRALVKADIGDLIESRHRFGYRLRVVPRDADGEA